MGCKCSKQKYDAQQDGGDLPAVNLANIKDPLMKWEKSYPFCRIHITNIKDKIFSLGKDKFSIAELGALIETPVWKGAFEPDNKTYKLLSSLADCKPESLDINSVLCLCILWCGGDMSEKAEALFQCLNPPGQSQEGISCNDKEWPHVFYTIAFTASAIAWRNNGQSINAPLLDRAIKALQESEEDEDQELNGFINMCFGNESRYSKQEFIDRVCEPEMNWVFDSTQFRNRLEPFMNEKNLKKIDF